MQSCLLLNNPTIRSKTINCFLKESTPAFRRSFPNRQLVASASAATEMVPFTIIGAGRVGQALSQMSGGKDTVIRRNQPIQGPPGPIIATTRNDDLETVVSSCPADRRKDLVFIQNGMLQPWLDAKGLGDNTQVLVYFAVAKLGDAPTDGKTELNPEGLTAAYGHHAQAVADRLHAADLSCKVLDKQEFQKSMLEKLIWIGAFMLVGAKNGGCTVGEVESTHRGQVEQLIRELAAAGETALGVQLEGGLEERLCAYARSVAHFPTAVKEFSWRNGWFNDVSKSAIAAGRPDPCPTHTSWLKEVGAI